MRLIASFDCNNDIWAKSYILFNGERIDKIIAFDTEEGWALQETGILIKGNYTKKEILYGRIELIKIHDNREQRTTTSKC